MNLHGFAEVGTTITPYKAFLLGGFCATLAIVVLAIIFLSMARPCKEEKPKKTTAQRTVVRRRPTKRTKRLQHEPVLRIGWDGNK